MRTSAKYFIGIMSLAFIGHIMRKYYPYFTNNETEPEKGLFLPPPSLLKILLKTLPQKRILFLGLAILVKTLGNENFLSSLIYNPGKSILLPSRPSPSFPSLFHTHENMNAHSFEEKCFIYYKLSSHFSHGIL